MERRLLDGKNIVVTGTARGMGRVMLETFAKNGANVWALARIETQEHLKKCEEISQEYGVEVMPLYAELSDPDAIKTVVNEIRKTKMPVDGLVNNAGITYNALFQMTKMEDLREQFEINFFAPYLLTQYISKMMIRNKKGSIVNISSTAAIDGNSGKSAYGASKAAIIIMTKCISEELANMGVRSNAICPGVTDTDMLSTLPDYIMDIQKEASFLKKIGKPVDIANMAMFLLSDQSSYVTGQVIRVDGGMTSYNKR